MSTDPRGERLQIMLTKEEFSALDDWRFTRHMPSRAAAVRELLRRGLIAEGFAVSDGQTKSGDFSLLEDPNLQKSSRQKVKTGSRMS